MPCSILSSSATQIVCKVGLNSGLVPNRKYLIELLVKNKGYALQNNYYLIEFSPKITSISPLQGNFFFLIEIFNGNIYYFAIFKGSLAGETLITVEGDGFVDSLTSITIGSIIYTKYLFESITYNSIKFNTIANENGTYEMSVTVNGLQAISENFTFSYY